MKYENKGRERRMLKATLMLADEYKIQLILSLIMILFILAGYIFYRQYLYLLRDPRRIKEWVMSYGKFSIIVLIALQILQVVLFFIPGGVVQIAGGYIYGTFLGTLIALGGSALGSAVIFMVTRKLGKPFLEKVVSEKDMKYFRRVLELGHDNPEDHHKKRVSLAVVFLLYLIPGLPKDVLGYICGITDIKLYDFLIYSTVARIPGILISSYFGSEMFTGDKKAAIIIAVLMTLIFVAGIFKGEKLIKVLTKGKK